MSLRSFLSKLCECISVILFISFVTAGLLSAVYVLWQEKSGDSQVKDKVDLNMSFNCSMSDGNGKYVKLFLTILNERDRKSPILINISSDVGNDDKIQHFMCAMEFKFKMKRITDFVNNNAKYFTMILGGVGGFIYGFFSGPPRITPYALFHFHRRQLTYSYFGILLPLGILFQLGIAVYTVIGCQACQPPDVYEVFCRCEIPFDAAAMALELTILLLSLMLSEVFYIWAIYLKKKE